MVVGLVGKVEVRLVIEGVVENKVEIVIKRIVWSRMYVWNGWGSRRRNEEGWSRKR